MSTPTKATSTSTRIVPLAGRHDYKAWAQTFANAAQRKGYWDLYTGKEPVKPKPNPEAYQAKINTATRPLWAIFQVEKYNSDLWERSEQKKRIRQSRLFIADALAPAIRPHIQKYQSPAAIWTALRDAFGREETPQERAFRNFMALQLTDCAGMAEYLNRLFCLRVEIAHVGGRCSDENVKMKILTSLSAEYAPHVVQELTTQVLADVPLEGFLGYLLACEGRVQGRLMAEGEW